MNSITRKLVLSVLTVVLTVIALGTTTFAWFTLTNTSVIQPFEAQVVSDTGIEVALGTGNPLDLEWRTVITTQEIYDYIEMTYDSGNPVIPNGTREFRFTHVSTIDGVNFVDMDGVGTTSGYLELPLHFRSDNESIIKWNQVSLSSTASGYTTGVTFVDSLGTTRTAGSNFPVNLSDAMKISVTGMTTLEPVAYTTVAYENPAGGTNTLSGGLVNAVLTNGGIGTNGALNFYYESTNTLPAGHGSVTTVSTLTALANNTVLTMTPGSVATADAEFYGTVMVRVWFEGWDAEAYNSLLGRILSISLRFGV